MANCEGCIKEHGCDIPPMVVCQGCDENAESIRPKWLIAIQKEILRGGVSLRNIQVAPMSQVPKEELRQGIRIA